MQKQKYFFTVLFWVLGLSLHAQTGTETPYSRYGIGELLNSGFARQSAMGGLGAAFQSSSAVNFSNPASYSSIRISTFETALRGELAQTSSSDLKQTKKRNFAQLSIFRFSGDERQLGCQLGLIPVSSTGYNLKEPVQVVNPNDTITTDFTKYYEGKGGLSRFYIGNGFAPYSKTLDKYYASQHYKDLKEKGDTATINKEVRWRKIVKGFSAGFNASYLFGSLNNIRRVKFSNSAFINTKITESTAYADFYFDYGIQYRYDFNEDNKLIIGISGAGGTNIKGRRDVLWTLVSSSDFEANIDTVSLSENEKGKAFIPSFINAGFMFQQGEKWLMGAEYATQQWSRYKAFNSNQNLKDSWRISAGAQYMPTNKLAYRAGIKVEQSYINLNDSRVNDYSLSLGVGVPVRLTSTERRLFDNRTMLHFSIEGGQLGTTSNNLD
ncbi:MAG: outer membrane protein transport protein [Bacteroidota bacterium]|nr:MAG: outer membrane protein transport protein [Bacteroidota bacterium]